MKLKYVVYGIIVLLCFVVEIVLIICKSNFVFIPILIALGAFGLIHFLEDIENIYNDKE